MGVQVKEVVFLFSGLEGFQQDQIRKPVFPKACHLVGLCKS